MADDVFNILATCTMHLCTSAVALMEIYAAVSTYQRSESTVCVSHTLVLEL